MLLALVFAATLALDPPSPTPSAPPITVDGGTDVIVPPVHLIEKRDSFAKSLGLGVHRDVRGHCDPSCSDAIWLTREPRVRFVVPNLSMFATGHPSYRGQMLQAREVLSRAIMVPCVATSLRRGHQVAIYQQNVSVAFVEAAPGLSVGTCTI